MTNPAVRETQITASELHAALEEDPVLAAAMGPRGYLGGEGELEARLSRAIRRRRGGASPTAGASIAGASEGAPRLTPSASGASRTASLRWAEFLALFVPTGPLPAIDRAGVAAGGGTGAVRERWEASGLDWEELEDLGAAFATADVGLDGRLSLSQLRALCAELDGEEPPEDAAREALEVGVGAPKEWIRAVSDPLEGDPRVPVPGARAPWVFQRARVSRVVAAVGRSLLVCCTLASLRHRYQRSRDCAIRRLAA